MGNGVKYSSLHIANNTVLRDGGGIYWSGLDLEVCLILFYCLHKIENCEFVENTANRGGGIALSGSLPGYDKSVCISDSVISKNVALEEGGK